MEWRQAEQIAAMHLGDETLVHELMELAVLQTGEHLADRSPIGVDEAREILARFYRNAVRRRQRANSKFSFRGTASELEFLASSRDTAVPALEAELDLEAILRETPPDLRRAMLMRYGAHTPWEVIAREMSNSKDAIRKRCRRELDRIRRKLGIGDGMD
jgi:DNA-directed RNA polymerase specialized sigma24 family protein